jgi:hypothetical protein
MMLNNYEKMWSPRVCLFYSSLLLVVMDFGSCSALSKFKRWRERRQSSAFDQYQENYASRFTGIFWRYPAQSSWLIIALLTVIYFK